MSQKKRSRGIAVLVVAIVAAAGLVTALARRGSKETPPMQDLSSTEQLKQRFQQDNGKVRLIALVSPICPECRRGFADMQSVLKDIPDSRLRAYVVWLSRFPGDSRSWSPIRSGEFKDDWLSYYSYSSRLTGEEWTTPLSTNR